MWGAALAFFSSLFRAIAAWQDGRQRDADRKSGEDAAFNRAQGELLERVKKANDIDRAELPDSLLIRPEERDSK